MKRNYLVVAANSQLREALAGALGSRGFTVTRASSGREAEQVVDGVSIDTVLIESHLPDLPAEELRSRLVRARPDCRVIVVSSFDEARRSSGLLQLGAGNYLIHASQISNLLAPVESVAESVSPAASDHVDALIAVIDVLVGLIELDDRFFGGTSHKAMRLARETAEAMLLDIEAQQEIVIATLLRDIGKVGVDPVADAQDGPLTESQQKQMQEHVSASLRLFEQIDFPWKVMPIIRHHHERYDGTGYPDMLHGREVPIGARIIAVVDAFVAMTSGRRHRDAIDPESALQELIRQAGRQFDPEVVEAVQTVLDQRLKGRGTAGKPRVLIADGHEDFRRVLKLRLINEGLDVLEVETSERALEVMLKDPPDLVLADLDADANEAFQLFGEMREDDSLSRMPFAFLSSKSDRVVKIRALRQGVDDFLCKTDDLEVLVARVESILTREAIRRDQNGRRPRRGITGDLENLSLPDIVQTLAMGMKTACLTIHSDGRKGQLWFDNGTATHAESADTEGETAFFEMVRWTSGEFVIEHGASSPQHSLQQDPMFLLMEGLRRLDEERHGSSKAAS